MDTIKLQILTEKPELRAELAAKLKTVDYIIIEKPIHFQGDLKDSFSSDISDVVLISENYLGDGYEASKIITTEYPYKTVILLEDELSQSNVRRAVTSGASDIIAPDADTEELTEVIHRTYAQHLHKQEMMMVSKNKNPIWKGRFTQCFPRKAALARHLLLRTWRWLC